LTSARRVWIFLSMNIKLSVWYDSERGHRERTIQGKRREDNVMGGVAREKTKAQLTQSKSIPSNEYVLTALASALTKWDL
jgi:hypothetical protein